MFQKLQATPIQCLKRHLDAWKLRGPNGRGMSEATMFDEIVAAHNRIGGPERTGIRFNEGDDLYNRQKANALRVKRLLADEDPVKDDLADQLVNLLPSILAAMPADLRISFLNDYLTPLDMHVAGNDEADDGELGISDLAEIMHKDAQMQQSFAAVLQSPDLSALTAAYKDINESIETKKKKGRFIAAMIRAKSATGSAIKAAITRAIHPKKVEA